MKNLILKSTVIFITAMALAATCFASAEKKDELERKRQLKRYEVVNNLEKQGWKNIGQSELTAEGDAIMPNPTMYESTLTEGVVAPKSAQVVREFFYTKVKFTIIKLKKKNEYKYVKRWEAVGLIEDWEKKIRDFHSKGEGILNEEEVNKLIKGIRDNSMFLRETIESSPLPGFGRFIYCFVLPGYFEWTEKLDKHPDIEVKACPKKGEVEITPEEYQNMRESDDLLRDYIQVRPIIEKNMKEWLDRSGYIQQHLKQQQSASSGKTQVTDVQGTNVSAYLQTEIEEGKNTVYCATFQLAWNEFCDMAGGTMKLTGDPEIAKFLNAGRGLNFNINSEDYFTDAGFKGDGILEEIEAELKRRGQSSDILSQISLERSDDFLVYAFLSKDLKFAEKFENFEDPLIFNGTTPVASFGINGYNPSDSKDRNLAEEVEILDFRGRGDFILKLNPASSDDKIIIAQVTPGKTLEDTINAVFSRMSNPHSYNLGAGDTVKIPKIDTKTIIHHYPELIGKDIMTPGKLNGYTITEAIQSVQFALNEEGAKVKSEAAIGASRGMGGPTQIVVNGPFLVMLSQGDAETPYLAVWVDNADLLTKP